MSDSVFVPRWVILSVVLGVIGSGVLVALQIKVKLQEAAALRAEIQRRDQRAATFRWGGVEWPLTLNFWGIVLHTSAGHFERGEADASLLHASIGDPLCPRCHYEVWPCAIQGKCGNCQTTFQLGLSGLETVSDGVRFRLKLDVYRVARAQYWQNQTGGPNR